MKKIALLVGTLIIVFLGFLVWSKNSNKEDTQIQQAGQTEVPANREADFTANFEIYTNGTKRVFTDSKYHNLSTDIYIESLDPSEVHVKRAGATWSDLFDTLPMSLSKDCLTTGTGQVFCTGEEGELKFILNDANTHNALDQQINPGDKLVVMFE